MWIKVLIVVALLPAVGLGAYIYKKDSADKEPPGLLMLLLGLGVVICFPASFLENILINLLQLISGGRDGGLLYSIIENFFIIALVEEGLKWLVLYFVTSKSRYFNSLFDGLIYAVFVSLGFAAFENIMYVMDFGISVGLMRAVTAVPAHTFFGVMMGYQYSMWHMYKKAGEKEKELKVYGLITEVKKPFSGVSYLGASLIIPIAAHGLYDLYATSGSLLFTALFYCFLIFMYIFSFRKVKVLSRNDTSDERFADTLLMKKYPELRDVLGRSGSTDKETGDESGFHTYTWQNGAKYAGQWGNGTMNGQGTYYFNNPNCLRYEGGFRNGKFDGAGRVFYSNGIVFEGNFFCGSKHGEGTIYYPDGRIQKGLWQYGVLVRGINF